MNRTYKAILCGIIAVSLIGCAKNMESEQPNISNPDNGDTGTESPDYGTGPKRPIPIKPKRNPGGKIERPKMIDDLINQIISPMSMSHDMSNMEEPR